MNDPYETIKDNLKNIVERLKRNKILLSNVDINTTYAKNEANEVITLSFNEKTPATPEDLNCSSGIITEFKQVETPESGITPKHIVGNIVLLASCVPKRQIGSFLVQLIIYLARISDVKELSLTDETGDTERSSRLNGVYENFKPTSGKHKSLKLSDIKLEKIKANIKRIFNKQMGLLKKPPDDEEMNIFWNGEGTTKEFFKSLEELETGKFLNNLSKSEHIQSVQSRQSVQPEQPVQPVQPEQPEQPIPSKRPKLMGGKGGNVKYIMYPMRNRKITHRRNRKITHRRNRKITHRRNRKITHRRNRKIT